MELVDAHMENWKHSIVWSSGESFNDLEHK